MNDYGAMFQTCAELFSQGPSDTSRHSFLLSPKATSEHRHRAPRPTNKWPTHHRRWNLWTTTWTLVCGHPCRQPSLQFPYNARPPCDTALSITSAASSHLWRPYFGPVHRSPAQYPPGVTPPLQAGCKHRPSPLSVSFTQVEITNPGHGTPRGAQFQSTLPDSDPGFPRLPTQR